MSRPDPQPNPDVALEPDDIIVPDKEEEDRRDHFEELSTLGKLRLPWSMHILTFCGGFLLLIWGLVTFISWLIMAAFDIVCMERIRLFSLGRRWFWWCAKHATGVGTGLLIATINPPLGFGMIILYIAYQEGEDLTKGKFFQSVREYLRQYEK